MRFRLADLSLLLLTLMLALAARVGYLVQYADNAATAGPLRVEDETPELMRGDASSSRPEQDGLLENMKSYRWFGCLAPLAADEERTAHTAPGYPWLLGELARLAPASLAFEPAVRWAQAGIGASTAVLYFLFALRAFGSRVVAILAGVLCALHPFWIVATASLSDGVLAAFLLAACIFLGARGGDGGGALTSLLLGLALAGLALVRAALLPFAVVTMLWFLLRCRRLANGWLAAILAFLGFVTGLAPWALRNFDVFHDVYPIVDSMYLHLWMGNHPQATGGPQDSALLAESLGKTREELARLEQPDRYRSLARPMVEELQRDPQAALQRRLWAGLCFFFGEDWLTQRKLWREIAPADSGNAPDSGPLPLLLLASLLGMLLLGVLGWRLTYGWRHASLPAALAVCWVPLPYILSHGAALSGPRLPLDGVLLCYAAFTLACVLPGIGQTLLQGAPPSESDEPR